MKIIFMGTPEFALPTFHHLLHSEHDVVAAYCQPPRPAGRGQKLTSSPVQKMAEAHNIPVHYPTSLKQEDEQKIFADYAADIAVVAAYGLLLPPAILEAPTHGCINIHPSKLPRWRGAAPIQRPIMAGDSMTAVAIMQMEEGLDTGAILNEVDVPIPADANAGQMHDALSNIGADLLMRTLEHWDQIQPTPQSEDGVTYAKKIEKSEAKIDWSQDISAIYHHIRGLSPTPGAYFIYQGEKYKILKAAHTKIPHDFPAGSTINDQLHIACHGGILFPQIVQRQGKKPMETQELLRGMTIPPQSHLEE